MDISNIYVQFAIFFLTFTSICVSMVSCILSIFTLIELKSMQKSTHNIEYVAVDPDTGSSQKEVEEYNNMVAEKSGMEDLI